MPRSWALETWHRESQPLIKIYPTKSFRVDETFHTDAHLRFIYHYVKCPEHPRNVTLGQGCSLISGFTTVAKDFSDKEIVKDL